MKRRDGPDPATQAPDNPHSVLGRAILALQKSLHETTTGKGLNRQTRALDILFRGLMLNPGNEALDERYALFLALRAHKQFRQTVHALDIIDRREKDAREILRTDY